MGPLGPGGTKGMWRIRCKSASVRDVQEYQRPVGIVLSLIYGPKMAESKRLNVTLNICKTQDCATLSCHPPHHCHYTPVLVPVGEAVVLVNSVQSHVLPSRVEMPTLPLPLPQETRMQERRVT